MHAIEAHTRKRLFYLMAALFVVITPLVLLYSRGYVFDLKTRDIISTGGIFVKAVQPDVRITINPDITKETSFLSRGALITSLTPRRYTVRVEKDGYRPWAKELFIQNEEVLEFRDIFLPPATITPTVVFSTRREGESKLVPLDGRAEVAMELGPTTGPRTLYLVNPETGRSSLNFIGVKTWSWEPQTGTFIIGRGTGARTQWFRYHWIAGGVEERLRFRGLPPEFSPDAVTPHPTDPNQFYFFAGGSLFLQGNAAVPIPIADALHAYAIGDDHIYYLSKNGFFAESNLLGQEVRILGRKGLLLSDEEPASITIASNETVLVRDSSGALLLYEPGTDTELQFIAGNILGVSLAPGGDRILFWDQEGLWLYWLEDNSQQPFDLARTKQRISEISGPLVAAAFDANSSHIVFATQNGIRMIETDIRGTTNSYDLVGSPVDSFAMNPETWALYWTRGPSLFRTRLQ